MVQSAALTATETAAAAETTTISIKDNSMTTTGSNAPSMMRRYLDCATTSHICGDEQRIEWYTEYSKRDELEICDFAGRKAGKATMRSKVQLRHQSPGG